MNDGEDEIKRQRGVQQFVVQGFAVHAASRPKTARPAMGWAGEIFIQPGRAR
jgi:hypothetical protein